MSDSEFVPALCPDPVDLADLLIRATRLGWPTTEDERQRYFAALGLRDLGPAETRDGDPETVWHRFATSLPGEVEGSAITFRGEFLGLHVFAYHEPGDDGPAAREGFAMLREYLSEALGAPAEEWGTPNEPACVWLPGPLTVGMYCFQRGSSGIMVGPSHAERSAANDAAHEPVPPPDSGRPVREI